MITVADHYRTLLAPIYLWMAGGADAAFARGESELQAVLPGSWSGLTALDLGAGFGMHSIPLARRGCQVVAIDSSPLLLEQLRHWSAGLSITAVEDDLALFQQYTDRTLDVILCMGDTLTHLPNRATVDDLLLKVSDSLRAGGKFIASFRDYTVPLVGIQRFIPVRSDTERVMTCCLEYGAEHVEVHDLLHERHGNDWQFKVSAYRKLRLDPGRVCAALESHGLSVRVEPGLSGMIRIVAEAAR
jgi:SAM-dependent methyltransferase